MKRTQKKSKPFIEVDPEVIELLKDGAKAALWIIGGVAAITVAVALPGLAQVIGQEMRRGNRAEMRRIYIREMYDPLGRNGKKFDKSRKTLYYLRKQGYVTFNTSIGESVIKLTEKGKKYLQKLLLIAAAPRKPKVWDKTWWIVLADIPTKTHRKAAELLRLKLKSMGFYPLQRTVWVHPYDPTRTLNELTNYYDLGKFVTLVQAQKLDSEDIINLKKYFKL